MKKEHLPSFEECQNKIALNKASKLQLFIHENEPAGIEDSDKFRSRLAEVITEHEYKDLTYSGGNEFEHSEYITLSDGKKMRIDEGLVLNIVNQLRELPIEDAMLVLGYRDEAIERFYIKHRNKLRKQITEHFKRTWYWREEGSEVPMDRPGMMEILFGKDMPKAKFIKHVNSSSISLTDLRGILDVFEENNEIYTKDGIN